MFDFTSMYAADNACRAKKVSLPTYCATSRPDIDAQPSKKLKSEHCCERAAKVAATRAGGSEGLLLMGLVGDSLLEPFWPTGSGCARGFLSSMVRANCAFYDHHYLTCSFDYAIQDAAWMVRQWSVKKCSVHSEDAVLDVLCERESIYRLLGQTKPDNLSQNYATYTINPNTRYPNLNATVLLPHQCKHLLYDDVQPVPYETRVKQKQSMAAKRARRATIASASPFVNAVSENVVEDVESHVRTVTGAIKETENELPREHHRGTNDHATRELEDSYKAFEENYHGLITGASDIASTNSDHKVTVPNRFVQFTGFTDLTNSPSASNLATIGRSRAKEIESALR